MTIKQLEKAKYRGTTDLFMLAQIVTQEEYDKYAIQCSAAARGLLELK
jgi:hypothetical protein